MNEQQLAAMRQALKRAFRLGQDYWSWADSEYSSHWKKADNAKAEFDKLVEDTTQPAQPAPVQEPGGCEGAIVNGRVYADRLEHHYKFECEAGPLHLCNDWVEFRRCFDWLAEHATPPAAPVQESMTWVERWYGSGPDQGWWIWERHSLTHGQAVARIGTGPFAERLTSIIVEKHNAALFPTELVKEPFAPDPHNGTGPTPPAAQRQWVGLTQQDIDIAFDDTQEGGGFNEFAYAIEQRLKEKNT